MNLFFPKHHKLLAKLNHFNVSYIVIGGYSVIFHGYKRFTGDVDLWLKPDNKNRENLAMALSEMGFLTEQIMATDFEEHVVFSIWEDPEKVDFLTRINLVEYEEADSKKIIADMDGLQVPFLHLNHLILSKINTNRPQDMADIDMLQKIVKLKQ